MNSYPNLKKSKGKHASQFAEGKTRNYFESISRCHHEIMTVADPGGEGG